VSRRAPADLAASVRQRLLNIAKSRSEELQSVLTRYGIERLLYRLAHTPARERFVLKGAILFALWDGAPTRPTQDVDFLAFGDASPDALASTFRAICGADVEPDGLTFLADTVAVEPIRGQRIDRWRWALRSAEMPKSKHSGVRSYGAREFRAPHSSCARSSSVSRRSSSRPSRRRTATISRRGTPSKAGGRGIADPRTRAAGQRPGGVAGFTVTVDAPFFPSLVAVIVAVPGARAVTTPVV
jgi:hypothetical protein